jgi:replicative DNA helicase Mcm
MNFDLPTGTNDTIRLAADFLSAYAADEISDLATAYPSRTEFTVDWSDMLRFDADFAEDYLENPDTVSAWIESAVEYAAVPNVELTDVTVRVVGLNEADIYRPIQLVKQRPDGYIGVSGDLAKVTEPKPEADVITYECQRCGVPTPVPQSGESAQEPHECQGCERQGPFEPLMSESEFVDYAKVRVEMPPDQTGDLQREYVDGVVRGDLVWGGHEDHGIVARSGDSVTVYGTVEYRQQDGKGANDRLFEPYLDVRAIEFDTDADDVDIEAHREEFTTLAERDDAVDVFANSLVPQLYATAEWERALEALVAYLFGAPRIDIDEGPTYRGDIHVLIVSDYGMGKSMVNSAIADFSPSAIKESVTGMSSDVGLLAAAVEDDFAGGDWTLKPGVLVRANGGHVILDEIDKTDADLERMNDALEGEQVVDVNKAGQSATFNSRVGLLATGNPDESRFDRTEPVASQLGIDQSLLSRFDAIVTMRDEADREQDASVAETQARSYVEAAEYDRGDRDEFDTLERTVSVPVGRAWVAYARQHVDPVLQDHHVDLIRDWYAEEVRQLNEDFADNNAGDMPVPASARSVMDTIRFAVAFARVHLRDTVADEDVERAMSLSKSLIGQTFDGDQFQPEATRTPTTQKERIDVVRDLIDACDDGDGAAAGAILTAAQEDHDLAPSDVEQELQKLKDKGAAYEPQTNHYKTT